MVLAAMSMVVIVPSKWQFLCEVTFQTKTFMSGVHCITLSSVSQKSVV